jgi:hypothetical protein
MPLYYRGCPYEQKPRFTRIINSSSRKYIHAAKHRGTFHELYRAPEAPYKKHQFKYRGNYVRSQEIDLNQNLAAAAIQIENVLNELQNGGMNIDEGRDFIVKEIAGHIRNNPHQKKKILDWGQSLSNSEVNETVKTTVNRVLTSVI